MLLSAAAVTTAITAREDSKEKGGKGARAIDKEKKSYCIKMASNYYCRHHPVIHKSKDLYKSTKNQIMLEKQEGEKEICLLTSSERRPWTDIDR